MPKDEPLNILEYENDINEAMAEIDGGEFYTQEEVEVIIKRRYEKITMV